jgi:hypothetical protein
MTREVNPTKASMEYAVIPGTALEVSRVGIGTWAAGGWM